MRIRFLIIVIITAMTLANPVALRAQSNDVAVVVNEKNPVINLTLADLRKLFSGEKRTWSGGMPVKLFVRALGAHERVVLLQLLGMSEMEYKEHWTALVYRGQVLSEPVMLFSNGMQREAVQAYPGALAIVNLPDVKPGMKVLRIDGHLPGEPGYPIK